MDIYSIKWTKLQASMFSFLSLHARESFSQRDIAKALKVSPTAVGKALSALVKEEVVHVEKVKNVHFVSLNVENERVKGLKRAENLHMIYASGLYEYLHHALARGTTILFGEFSQGEDTIESPIEIAVVGRKEQRLDIGQYEKRIHKKIDVVFFSSWNEIRGEKRHGIVNGIVLQGSVVV
ncbi:MAG: hypothetical protein ABIH34_06505 [Nanoarchaeota archaeon]